MVIPIVHGVFFVIIEVAEIRAKKLDKDLDIILKKIVSESIKMKELKIQK